MMIDQRDKKNYILQNFDILRRAGKLALNSLVVDFSEENEPFVG